MPFHTRMEFLRTTGVFSMDSRRPRWIRRQDVPRIRQENGGDRVGNGTARRRQQLADDLHGERQAVHPSRGIRTTVSRRTGRAGVTVTKDVCSVQL